jgi:hypothetical protein
MTLFSRGWWLAVVVLLGVSVGAGCRKNEADVPETEAKLAIHFNPNPPVIGNNELEITLSDANGAPIRLGRIKVEGNMNHAGMKPIFAEFLERDPGKYTGSLQFTMGGDWFLLVTSEASPSGTLNLKINVPGVRSK